LVVLRPISLLRIEVFRPRILRFAAGNAGLERKRSKFAKKSSRKAFQKSLKVNLSFIKLPSNATVWPD
jgi:hypothetical protein